MSANFAGRNKSKDVLFNALALLFILLLPIFFFSLSFYHRTGKERAVVITLLMIDIIPFTLGLIWFVRQYKRSTSDIGTHIIDFLSFIFVCGFPLIAYWQSRYTNHDERALPSTLLLTLDVLPLVFGLMWLAHRWPKASGIILKSRIYFMPLCLIFGLILTFFKIFTLKH